MPGAPSGPHPLRGAAPGNAPAPVAAAPGAAPQPAPGVAAVAVNGQGGAPAQQPGGTPVGDFSQQWLEYYRSHGMHAEADKIEQQIKAAKVSNGGVPHTQYPTLILPLSGHSTTTYLPFFVSHM